MTAFRDFDLDAYNARLARISGAPKQQSLLPREMQLPKLLESDVLPAVLAALRLHPKVAFVWRQNAGVMDIDGRNVRFAFKGCSDILGMLKPRPGERVGAFLACEVKRPGGMPTPDQARFLALVESNGGVAFVARRVDDVMAALA
jgi:hypothetical protein